MLLSSLCNNVTGNLSCIFFFVFLSRLIEKTIFSAYKLVCQTQISTAGASSGSGADPETGSTSLNRSFINLPKELFEMLASAGPYLYRDALLLQKVCYPSIFVTF